MEGINPPESPVPSFPPPPVLAPGLYRVDPATMKDKRCKGCNQLCPIEALDGDQRCMVCSSEVHALVKSAQEAHRDEFETPLPADGPATSTPPHIKTPEEREQATRAAMARRRSRYGVTADQYNDLIVAAGNQCGVCKRAFTTSKGNLPSVDRDAAGAIRGVLCTPCARAMSRIGKNADQLVQYLTKTQPQTPNPTIYRRIRMKKCTTPTSAPRATKQ